MWANAQRDGRPAEYNGPLLHRAAINKHAGGATLRGARVAASPLPPTQIVTPLDYQLCLWFMSTFAIMRHETPNEYYRSVFIILQTCSIISSLYQFSDFQ